MDELNIHLTPQYEWRQHPRKFIVANDGDTVASSMVNGVLVIAKTGGETFNIPWHMIDRIDGVKVMCPQTGVAQVDTLTLTALPQTFPDQTFKDISVTITWQDPDTGEQMKKTYTETFSTSITWTETLVTDKLVTKINSDPDAIVTASNSGGHLRLTADTPGMGFATKYASTLYTLAHTTANRIDFGSGSSLIAHMGFSTDDGIQDDDDVEYCIVEIPAVVYSLGDEPTNNSYSQNITLDKQVVWVVVEVGGTAEDSVLGTSQSTGLCKILTGADTAAKYIQVISAGCPCS